MSAEEGAGRGGLELEKVVVSFKIWVIFSRLPWGKRHREVERKCQITIFVIRKHQSKGILERGLVSYHLSRRKATSFATNSEVIVPSFIIPSLNVNQEREKQDFILASGVKKALGGISPLKYWVQGTTSIHPNGCLGVYLMNLRGDCLLAFS